MIYVLLDFLMSQLAAKTGNFRLRIGREWEKSHVSERIITIDESRRNEAIELVNQFFRQVNNMQLDGIFKIRPRAAAKMTDIYLKLVGAGNVVFIGMDVDDELTALLIARVEDKPFLEEERVLFIDLAVTKKGKMKKGYMKQLVRYTENWAKERNIQSIELRAITENDEAVKFWKKMGYTDFYIRFRKTTAAEEN